jgi:sugar lactone lactonase YvrE
MMNGFNVDVNGLDATHRHQGMNWNTDPGVFQPPQDFPLHIVDTPGHTNPSFAGYVTVRAYDISTANPPPGPNLIVRDVASGCAYPAAYVRQTLQVVAPNRNTGMSWLNNPQEQSHSNYDDKYLAPLCYGTDPRNVLSWARGVEYVPGGNPYSNYLKANLPPGLSDTLAAAGEVMRFRLRIPVTPPTPCTNGCSRSGNEQMRYMSLSFLIPNSASIASLEDSAFTQDANGYATLIVGTGAAIPSWITPANGYTFLDMKALSGYETLQQMVLRNIEPSSTFACSGQTVPYNTTVYTPQGSLMGDYLPVVDYPLAATLPPVASALVGPNACGVFPIGQPAEAPNCGVVPSNPIAIASIPAPTPAASPVVAQPSPPIAITGDGFGIFPNGLPFTGNSNYLKIADVTQNWSAGYTGSPCNVSISNWLGKRIELVANVNQNGQCPLVAGDQLTISVWNPQTMTGPATATVAVAPANISYALGGNAALVGSAGGNGTVLLMANGPWTAASNASWLHLSAGSASGVGGALIQFSYDPNLSPGAQTGTLAIAGLTFTVTQAGKSYVPVNLVAALFSSGLNDPQGVAVDGQGNLYIADTANHAIKEWMAGNQQVITLAQGLSNPSGVAVDGQGNVYFSDTGNHAIKEWMAANQQVITLAPGLSNPSGVAVDGQGNVYFSDTGTNAIKEWHVASNQVTTLIGSGLRRPEGVAVDGQGNVYFADAGNNAIEEWAAVGGQVSALVSSGLNNPTGVAVDGQGNVYLADTGHNAIKQWSPASRRVITLVSSGLKAPAGVAVDGQGNVYIADTNDSAIKKFTAVYLALGATSRNEGPQAGTDSVTVQVLPAGTPLTAQSNRPWLTITGTGGESIGFSFQANTSVNARTAQITVLGQPVTVTQSGDIPASITKTGGAAQSTPVGQAFGTALQVRIKDAAGEVIQDAAVTFTVFPGADGASGTFSSPPPMPILTDAKGYATAPTLTANSIAGTFRVKVTVGGSSATIAFSLTITPQ